MEQSQTLHQHSYAVTAIFKIILLMNVDIVVGSMLVKITFILGIDTYVRLYMLYKI